MELFQDGFKSSFYFYRKMAQLQDYEMLHFRAIVRLLQDFSCRLMRGSIQGSYRISVTGFYLQ